MFLTGDAREIEGALRSRVQDALTLLDAAESLADLKIGGYDLHALRGEWKGFWSIKASGNWRVVFRFDGGQACEVDLVDYH
jgi:proteic killer suppression protein